VGRGCGLSPILCDVTDGLDPVEVLRVRVEEYRFQVQLNASRTNYWFSLVAALLVVGATLAGLGVRPAAAAVFGLAAAASGLCGCAVHVQHGYYQAARDAMLGSAVELGVPRLLATTPGMRGVARGRLRVATVTVLLFLMLSLAGLVAGVGVLTTVS